MRFYIRLGVVALLIGVLGYGWHYIHKPGVFPIHHVAVEGDYNYVPGAALKAKIIPFVDRGFFNVAVHPLRQKLLELPGVSEVRVKRDWPDTVEVFITRKEPIARWGADKLVTSGGDLIKPEKMPEMNNLPKFSGASHNVRKMVEKYRKLKELDAGEYQISKLVYRGNQWQVILASGVRLRLGNSEVALRFKRYLRYAPRLREAHPDKKARYYDFRYPEGFAVKWKKSD